MTISCHHIQVAVSIHIAKRDCLSVINIRAYISTSDAIEWISGAAVQVKFIGQSTKSSRHHIQVAVSIHIT